KKAASVTPAAGQHKTYGDADPALSGSTSGFLAADGVTASYSRAAGETVAGGPYHITATLGAGAGVLDNYIITNAGADFSIAKRAATWTTDPNSKTLGAADPNPLTTGKGTFRAADGVTAMYSRAPGENIGAYHITATLSASVSGALGNYTVTNDGNNFSILYASSGMCLGEPGHGVLQPINADGSSVFKQGSTVPAKFRVCDANGNSVGTAGVVASFKLVRTTASAGALDESVVSTTPDTDFRWSATDQQWIFNMGSKSLKANTTYYYDITLQDGTHILFNFGLK
ncbi:MAG: hypothetical protein DMD55_00185, partial [Gemmatimonadetes bacterium]